MVNWIAAVRRCAVSKPGRHTEAGSSLAKARQMQESGDHLRDAEPVTSILRPPSANDTHEDVLLRNFVQDNSCCAECNAQPVTYVINLVM